MTKRVSSEQLRKRREQEASQSRPVGEVLRAFMDRLEEPGILARYETLWNDATAAKLVSCLPWQQKMLAEILLQGERNRLTSNVDASRTGAADSVDRLFNAVELLLGFARKHMDGAIFVDFAKLSSELMCAAAQCGNLDAKSELPKHRAADHAEGMRRKRAALTGPAVEGRRRQLIELLRRAPARIGHEPDAVKKQTEFRKWLETEQLVQSWKRSTLIRDISAILPSAGPSSDI